MIAVATLLVAVVGATFAYFTATNTTEQTDRGKVEVETATVGGAKLTTTSISSVGKLDYPGGVMVSGTKVVAEKQNPEDENEYDITYDIGLTATNQTDQEIKWYLVRVDGSFNKESLESTTCTLSTTPNGTETQYKYTGCTAVGSGGIIGRNFSDSDLIAYGTISAKTESSKISVAGDASNLNDSYSSEKTPIGLTKHTLHTSGGNTKTTYIYYLIVEFPNQESDQNGSDNENFGKTISVTFDEITNVEAQVSAS